MSDMSEIGKNLPSTGADGLGGIKAISTSTKPLLLKGLEKKPEFFLSDCFKNMQIGVEKYHALLAEGGKEAIKKEIERIEISRDLNQGGNIGKNIAYITSPSFLDFFNFDEKHLEREYESYFANQGDPRYLGGLIVAAERASYIHGFYEALNGRDENLKFDEKLVKAITIIEKIINISQKKYESLRENSPTIN